MLRLKDDHEFRAVFGYDPPTSTPICPIIGQMGFPNAVPDRPRSMSGLIDEAKKLRAELRQAEKAKRAAEKYVTAAKWRYGKALAVIHAKAKNEGKGAWKKALAEIGEARQRADEYIKIGSYFASAEEAGKYQETRALKLIRKGTKGSDVDDAENRGSSTPQWLFDYCNQLAIEACGERITLDVAAAEWNHKCERYYTEQDDGLTKDWDAKAVFCNSPYTAGLHRVIRPQGNHGRTAWNDDGDVDSFVELSVYGPLRAAWEDS